MDRFEHIIQTSSGMAVLLFRNTFRDTFRSKHTGCPKNLASIAGCARQTRTPDGLCLRTAVKLVHEPIEKLRFDCPVLWRKSAHQGTISERKKPEIRITPVGTIAFKVCSKRFRERGRTSPLFHGLNPFKKPPIIHSDKMYEIFRRRAILKGFKKLVQQIIGRAILPGGRSIEIDQNPKTVM